MRVATRIVTLTAALIALLLLVLALHLWWVQRLAEISRSLPTTTFQVGAANLALGRLFEELDEFSRKVDVSGADYLETLERVRDEAATRLRALAALELSAGERDAVAGLQVAWRQYRRLPPLLRDETARPPAATALGPHLAAIRLLDARLGALSAASERHLASTKRAARRTVSATKRVAWLVVAAALLVALPLLGWTIRSLHRPLRRLTAGTRDVAAGRFALRLDESGGDELAAVAASFNHMVRRLSELEGLKRDFLSHVSHELNTPLVAMRETNQLVLDGLAGPLTGEQRRMLELNRDGALRLSAMIGRILDLSRLEAGAMEYAFAPHELGALLETAVDEFSATARERGIALELALPGRDVLARCDRDRLLQVLANLLANALKFAPAGSRVRVALEAPAEPAARPPWSATGHVQRALITVSDEGPGVPPELRETIFEKFHRGAGPPARGFGLGLAISREIVTAHGGRIWVRENLPAGSVFGVELGAASRPAAARAASGRVG
ncbi:MAG: HAMP domain-containing histidine kinase [Acidobacteriota bacterium]|nr:HAMP domain-containing histidine kinase [Acidobacteriota bacterium]